MAEPRFSLAWADYVIFGVIVCISMAIGVYHALTGSRQRTTSEYLVADRRMSYIPVSLSFTVTFLSSIFFLGTPAEMYAHGIQYLFLFLGTLPANILAAVFTVPLFHHLRITSAYEYLEMRFQSMAVRRLGSCLGILTNVVYIGIVLFGPAVALNAVAGFPLWTSVVVIGLASILYTAIGGIKAVVWTDVFQSLIMLSGLVAISVKSIIDIGGINRFWELNKKAQRFDISFNLDPTIARTFWTCFIGGAAKWFTFGFNQSSILRYVSIPSKSDARKMVLWSTPTFLVLSAMAAFEGLCAFAFYSHKRCDPFEEGSLTNSNQILPYFLLELFHTTPGMPGLFLASLFSASMSTLSSCLSSISACALTDFIRPVIPKMSDFRATVVAKLIVVVFGGVSIGLSFLIMQLSGTVLQIASSFIGAIDGPACSLFLLGALVPFANKYGAFSGGVIGIATSLWLSLGSAFSGRKSPWLQPAPVDGCPANLTGIAFPSNSSMVLDWLHTTEMTYINHTQSGTNEPQQSALDDWYSISFNYHALVGIVVTFAVGILVSLITCPTKPSNVNPAYVSYLVRRCYYTEDRLSDLDKELKKLHDVKLDVEIPGEVNPRGGPDFTELPELNHRRSAVA